MSKIENLVITLCIFSFVSGHQLSLENVNWKNFSLEDLVFREEKVMHLPVPTPHVLNRPPNRITSPNNNSGSSSEVLKEVSETDLYLLGAIEKLVYRLDLMDQRLRRAEELIQHVMEGSNIKRQDPCPANFTRVARNCYYFNERQYNWKSASSMCKSLGGNLVELESKEEFVEMITYILSEPTIRGHDYWTGGLNPGLLWIWSNSARPVVPKNSTLPEDNIAGTGRCLKLGYTGSNKIYSYSGAECSIRFRFICEHEENLTDRALNRIHKSLKIEY
ncbi:C-type lectin domain family 2 member L-like [Planococcus citri]|uniref:C-type lectin domain family 2 member L-like n=1 Tax=Planococcus citri TaxID=170843 RepID=UPI0031F89051